MKIYDASGTLIRDYIPYLDDNNHACFKDLLSQTLLIDEGGNYYEQLPGNIIPRGQRRFVRQ
jgi:hypothetical protein